MPYIRQSGPYVSQSSPRIRALHQRQQARRGPHMKQKLDFNLSGDEVYHTACSLLVMCKNSCGKLHRQKRFDLVIFLYHITSGIGPFWRVCGASPGAGRAPQVPHPPSPTPPSPETTSSTLNLEPPYSVNPEQLRLPEALGLHALSPSPWTFSPQPSTLNPQPSTLNPQPSTLNLQLSTLNPPPSTINPQPSTFNPQPSTLNPQPSTLDP
jgi:hypothetical protein